jgi:hypothetical protein
MRMRPEAWYVLVPVAVILGAVAWSFLRAAAEADRQVWGDPDPGRGCGWGPRHSGSHHTGPPASIREWCDQAIREQVAARHQPGWDLSDEDRLALRQTLAEIEALPTTGEAA